MVPASLSDRFVIRFCVCAQRSSESDIHTAYQIISRFACDLYEILKIDEKARKEEDEYKLSIKNEARIETREDDESVDEVFVLDRKKKMSLRYKRSFFVRMVSDPKLYNPKIVKGSGTRSISDKESDGDQAEDAGVVTPL